jgi:hypothetical protein
VQAVIRLAHTGTHGLVRLWEGGVRTAAKYSNCRSRVRYSEAIWAVSVEDAGEVGAGRLRVQADSHQSHELHYSQILL